MTSLAADLRLLHRAPASALPIIEEALDRATVAKWRRESDRLRFKLERKHQPALERLFRDLGSHVAAVATDLGWVVEQPQEAAVDPTQKELAKINAIAKAAKLEAWRQEKILPWLEKLYEGAWMGVYGLAQTQLEPTVRDKLIGDFLKAGGRRLGMIDIPADTKAALFRVLEFSREWEAGQPSPRQVAKWIQQEVPAGRFRIAGPKYRAQLIARTEVMHSTRKAAVDVFRADPSVNTLVALDGDEDEDCAARNGTEFTIDDAEIEIDTEHPNGTLMFAPAYQK